ncbi:MAG: RNA polymerase sigma factor [Pseudomonadota bacterium]|uniref:RNA polymerase sigma factor n=1 Tax=Sphingomonas sp. ERG5 TaxID=1381597 RepID=UPI0009DCBE8D|nr:RNA polymerase sigma factor [Sphingomonas sp. ERG5]
MEHQARLLWFAREVLPHEADVRRWLFGRIRGLSSCELDEVVQEAYARIWAADIERIGNGRAYLFVTARHIVGEHVRRSRIVSIELVADLESLNIVDDEIGAHRRLSGEQEVERVMAAIATLPPKCRQAFQLKKFEELSQREIAERMGIAESTVEKHLAKALRLVMQVMKAPAAGVEDDDGGKRRLWGLG